MMEKKPLIAYGWLRALLYIVIGIPLGISLSFGTDLLINGSYTTDKGNVVVPIFTFLQQYILFNYGLILVVFFFRKVIDKRTIYSLGFEWNGHRTNAWTGFFTAMMILFVGSLILVSTKHLYFTNAFFNIYYFLTAIGLYIIVAFVEEIIFRGYILNNLMQSMNKWWALIISSLIFAATHLGNDNVQVLSIVNIFVAGLLLGINYIYTHNLWFGIFMHFGWNFFQGSVLGYNVSGIGIEPGSSIMQQSINGPEFLTGGKFGFEGSIICPALLLIMLFVFILEYERKKKRAEHDAEYLREMKELHEIE